MNSHLTLEGRIPIGSYRNGRKSVVALCRTIATTAFCHTANWVEKFSIESVTLEQGKQTLRLDKVNQILNLFGCEVGVVPMTKTDER